MSACPQCGHENKAGARFCVKCGASMEAPAQSPQAYSAPPVPPAPPQAAQPGYGQTAQPRQPEQYRQPYATPPAAPYPAAGAPAPAPAVNKRSGLFWVGAMVLLVCGLVVLISPFMAWITGPYGMGSIKGWDLVTNEMMKISNGFFDYGDGYPMFSGLCPLILGALIVLIAVLMLVFRSRGLGGVAILFSIFALGMAITNLTSILRDPTGMGLGVGAGLYLWMIFSFAGIVSGGVSMSR